MDPNDFQGNVEMDFIYDASKPSTTVAPEEIRMEGVKGIENQNYHFLNANIHQVKEQIFLENFPNKQEDNI